MASSPLDSGARWWSEFVKWDPTGEVRRGIRAQMPVKFRQGASKRVASGAVAVRARSAPKFGLYGQDTPPERGPLASLRSPSSCAALEQVWEVGGTGGWRLGPEGKRVNPADGSRRVGGPVQTAKSSPKDLIWTWRPPS